MVESIRILRYFDQHITSVGNDHSIEHIQTMIGSNLTLDCHVQLESNDRLYSLKWYRQYNGSYYEFYSYISNSNADHELIIHHKTFPGIRLHLMDGWQIDGQIIRLDQVNVDSEGIYRCEVISDEMFQVDRKDINVTILVPPMEAPRIIYPQKRYRLGELVQLQCVMNTTPISIMKSLSYRIQWYINNVAISPLMNSMKNWTVNVYSYQKINHLNRSKSDLSSSMMISNEMDENKNTLNHEMISLLEFIVGDEHRRWKGSNHFIIGCAAAVSSIESESMKSKHSQINGISKPVIEGLNDEYQIGDLVRVRCWLPANKLAKNVRIEWIINEKYTNIPVKMTKEKKRGGYSVELCFRLANKHLNDQGSFSLKCRSIQKLKIDKVNSAHLTMKNETGESNEEKKTNWPNMLSSFEGAIIPISVILTVIIFG
ncbi:hypothetical protein HUG17_4741 [Dermatophagoides farinae]|uniref:Ig-like domain-containing protein n=1 Tax=Dermatophagoides farinae TaxID=6954 RepID=A0A9D4NZ55_DERFA|nr:hypothetical protein HUG17_4741 [Dermatophagoides farinae]